jgi:uncharacterized protein (DUF1800 family)
MALLSTDRDKTAHLLRRFGLGASELELDFYSEGGFRSAIDKLLGYERQDEAFHLDVNSLGPKDKSVNMPGVVVWWVLRLIITQRPLQEKMTLFWHDHFATSASKVLAPLTMHQQNEVLRGNATGKFRTLLGEVSKDPAMIFWLDNQENVKGKPNENFAREVMELFTVGIGHYSEKDVQEAARAFTGWSIQRLTREQVLQKRRQAEFMLRLPRHDRGEKTVLGRSGDLSGDDVLDLLCDQPQTATYLTRKIWEWFVYPSPSDEVVEKFAGVFRQSGLDISALLRSIMESEEFVSDRAVRAVVKNPVDFCISTLRQIGAGTAMAKSLETVTDEDRVPRALVAPAYQAQQAMKNMGMWLFYPPDVSGWEGGSAWITSATMVERMKWAEKMFARLSAQVFLTPGMDSRALVDRMLAVLDVPLKPEKVPALVDAAEKASGGRFTRQTISPAAVAVGRLIFASPEFQFA